MTNQEDLDMAKQDWLDAVVAKEQAEREVDEADVWCQKKRVAAFEALRHYRDLMKKQ